MSEVIKLSVKKKKLNVSLKNPFEANNLETEKEEDYFQNQLKQHYEHGFTEGQKAAHERLEKDYSDKLFRKFEQVKQILTEFDLNMIAYSQAFEKTVVNLALTISEKIIKRKILLDSPIEEILHESLRRILGANKIIVKLNPDDLRKLNMESNQLFADESFSKIKFETDEKIEPGGCFVETEIGSVDARISSQLNEIKKQLESIFTDSEA